MNRVEELIGKLCPDGVEYKKLGQICNINGRIGFRGYTRNDFVSKGDGAISLSPSNIVNSRINYKECKYISWEKYFESPEIMVENGNILFCKTGSTVGKVAIVERLNEMATINPQLVLFKNIKCNSRYLYYVLSAKKIQDIVISRSGIGSVPNISQKILSSIEIPLPPLEIQNEIVNILDNFSKLEAELEAELEARKQQYEHYLQNLLSKTNESCVTYSLAELANVLRGEYITKKSYPVGDIPVILGGQEPAYFINTSNHTGEIVVIARSGASAGFVSYWDKPIFITDCFGYEAKEERVIPKYLYYLLKAQERELNLMKRGAGVPHVSGEKLLKLKFSLPPLEEQARIVSILDRFDKLCNDLTEGLPAEIEARRKQYEYYRDLLLTFKQKETNADGRADGEAEA